MKVGFVGLGAPPVRRDSVLPCHVQRYEQPAEGDIVHLLHPLTNGQCVDSALTAQVCVHCGRNSGGMLARR